MDVSRNDLRSHGGAALAEGVASSAITDLNVSQTRVVWNASSDWDESRDWTGIDKLLKSSSSLTCLNVLGNSIPAQQAAQIIKVVDSHQSLRTVCGINEGDTCLDFSGMGLSDACTLLLFAELERNTTLTALNLLNNCIGAEKVHELLQIKEGKPALKTLCGFTVARTEIDMSKMNLNIEDAMLLASEIKDNNELSLLTKLNLSSNNLELMSDTIQEQDTRRSQRGSFCFGGHRPALQKDTHVGVLALASALQENTTMVALVLAEYTLPIQDLRTARELDLSERGLGHLDAVVVARLVETNR